VAVSKADDKSGCLGLMNGRRQLPPFLSRHLSGLGASPFASFRSAHAEIQRRETEWKNGRKQHKSFCAGGQYFLPRIGST
jgi:hypothetical protein